MKSATGARVMTPNVDGRRTSAGPTSSGRRGGAITPAGLKRTRGDPGEGGRERQNLGHPPLGGGAPLRGRLRAVLRPGSARRGPYARQGRSGRVRLPLRGGGRSPSEGSFVTAGEPTGRRAPAQTRQSATRTPPFGAAHGLRAAKSRDPEGFRPDSNLFYFRKFLMALLALCAPLSVRPVCLRTPCLWRRALPPL